MKDFKGKVAVVLGAASGIGRALALTLADRECDVVVADIDDMGVKAVAAEAQRRGVRVLAATLDVTQYGQVEALADRVWRDLGRVDFLFNNAGVIGTGALLDEDPKKLAWIFSVNVFGFWNVLRVFGSRLRDQGTPAHICNTGSEHSLCVPNPMAGLYTASKHSVLAISDVLRQELPAHVGISILCPGIVRTKLWDAARNRPEDFGGPEASNDIFQFIIGQGMDPMEIARRALEGVARGDFFIVTHHHDRALVEARYSELLAAFDSQAPWTVDAERYDVMAISRKLTTASQGEAV